MNKLQELDELLKEKPPDLGEPSFQKIKRVKLIAQILCGCKDCCDETFYTNGPDLYVEGMRSYNQYPRPRKNPEKGCPMAAKLLGAALLLVDNPNNGFDYIEESYL